jgi:hypothetical protein
VEDLPEEAPRLDGHLVAVRTVGPMREGRRDLKGEVLIEGPPGGDV